MVHADAADFGALAMLEAEGGEEVCSGGVQGGVVGGCGGTVSKGAGDDAGVNVVGAGEGGEGGFEGEGVFLEPVEEGAVAEEARIGVLRGVDVRVCELDLGSS